MGRKGHVVSVAVLPDFRRRGIGRELVVSAMKALELHGGEECFLEVRTANDEAVKLYKDMGFDTVRTVSHRSEEHTSELQSRPHLVCRLLLEKKKYNETKLTR